ncbi:MAG: RDD family protein [Acidimicrobiales bacterium]
MPAPPASDPTNVFGRRVVAAIIDILILAVPAFMLASSQLEYLELSSSSTATAFCDQYLDENNGVCFNFNETVYFSDAGFGAAQAAGLGLNLLVLVVLQGLTGWTPGKLLLGLRTVRENGRPPGIGRAALRWVLLIVDGQPCGLPLVGFITGLTTKGHRRVGDMAAKTFVVRSSAAGSPIVVPGLTAPAPPAGYAAGGGWGTPAPPGTGASTGWGPAVDPSAGWGTPPEPSSPAAPSTATAPAPQWDEARGTYIQWDPTESAWMQWDEPGQRWFKIQGQ